VRAIGSNVRQGSVPAPAAPWWCCRVS
jgi:hypothetical protein